MKCLLCSASFNSDEKLIEHYIDYCKIDQDKFFQKHFQPSKKGSIFHKCLRCGDFLLTENFKVKHDFLKHYHDGENIPVEDKPLEIVRTNNITKCEVSVNKHSDYYNCEDAEQVVDDFLRNGHSKFKCCGDVLLKCGFLIENIQQSLYENLVPSLTLDIGQLNGMSGSSWQFRRFIYLNLKTLNPESEVIR